MNKRQIIKALKGCIPDMELVEDTMNYDEECDPADQSHYRSIFIGTFMQLDPCGRYHHILSPNGVTKRCEAYWERLNAAADKIGGWIESGEGDPCDQFFCMRQEVYNARTKS